MIILSPSLLAVDFTKIGEQIKIIENAGCEYLHLDVMDGIFVPNISFGQPLISSVRKITDMVFDVHLMIVEPYRYFEDFKNSGADIITFHYEACNNINDIRKSSMLLKDLELKSSISIKPNTDAEVLFPVLDCFDMVLVMSVEPGFGGQSFMPSSLESIRKLHNFRRKENLSFLIEIDGGVNKGNIKEIKKSGVDVVVAGSSIFSTTIESEVKETVEFFKNS